MAAMAEAGSASSKPRVLLSILKCSWFDHLEGESLFTSITAGFGRFDCDRLLKPSGVELMNLPPSANIEVCVLRRDRERQKHLLYHGLVALAPLQPVFAAARGEQGESGGEAGGDPPAYWEGWVGLFSSDVSLKQQSPERVFQRCLEMGSNSARFPRLLLRLQYLPPGASAAVVATAVGSRSLPPTAMPAPSASLEATLNSRTSSSTDFKDFSRSLGPPTTQAPAAAAEKDQQHQQQVVDALRDQLRQVERRFTQVQERESSREEALRSFFEQAGPSLLRLGRPPKLQPKEAAASTEASRAQLTEVVAALAAAKVEDEKGAGGSGSDGGAKDKEPARSGPGIFYKPVKTDPVDCMLAAAFLRLEAEPPAPASELTRVEPGVYRLASSGLRLKCHVSGGRVMAQPVEATGSFAEGALELFTLLRSLPQGVAA